MKNRFRDQPIIEEFKRRIEKRFPGELSRLIVFGSQARGDVTAESDVDVLAIVHSEDWRLGDEIRHIGYELEIAHGLVLRRPTRMTEPSPVGIRTESERDSCESKRLWTRVI